MKYLLTLLLVLVSMIGYSQDITRELQKQTRLLEQLQRDQKQRDAMATYTKAMQDLTKVRVIPYSNQVIISPNRNGPSSTMVP